MLTQPPIIQQGDNREQETKMETAVKHAVVLCGPRLPNICFSSVNVWFGPAASTHLLLAVLLPEAAISGLLWASFRWRFKRRKKKKKCATAGKRGWAEWFKGHSCQRVLVQTPGTFYIICRSYRTTGSSQTLFSRTISASFIWLMTPPPKKKRFSGSQMSCTTKKSLPHTLQIPITKMLSQLNLWLVHMAV